MNYYQLCFRLNCVHEYWVHNPYPVDILLYPGSGISMDEEIVLGDMIWSSNKAEL